MIASVDAFRMGRIEIRTLVRDLEGLLGAADVRDRRLIDEWWNHAAPIVREAACRTEDLVSERASDENLDRALSDFRAWACSVLDSADPERK